MTHTSTEQPEALPCPFCGNEAKSIYSTHQENWRVECWSDYCGVSSARFDAKLKAIRQWNRRAPATQAQRVPLSDEYIRDIYAEESHWDMVAPYVIAFARSIEAAHGITQEKQG